MDSIANLALLKDYQSYLRVEKGLRPLTCEAYLGDLRTFAEYLETLRWVTGKVPPAPASLDSSHEEGRV